MSTVRRSSVVAVLACVALAVPQVATAERPSDRGPGGGPHVAGPEHAGPGRGADAAASEPGAEVGSVPAVQWGPCPAEVEDKRIECATYEVPRDYAEPNGPTLQLALTRLPATDTTNRIGSLFVNPGGPGGSGVDFAQSTGELLSTTTRGRFDIVGFDPRGVGASEPAVRCNSSLAEQALSGFDSDLVPDNRNEIVEFTAQSEAFTALCGQRNADLLPYVSTEFVARDLDRLRAAVGDEQLTYYGLSYGTILGQTHANLFPDRARALALDGVWDPIAYTNNVTDLLRVSLVDSEKTLNGFFRTCAAAGPERCALADDNPWRVFYQLLDTLRRDGPLPALSARIPGTIGEDEVTQVVFSLLYTPSTWPLLAAGLDRADAGDGSILRDLLLAVAEVPNPEDLADAPYNNLGDANAAVRCTDSGDDGDPDRWSANAQQVARTSRLFGPLQSWGSLGCATWPVEAASRYAGPWNAHTANPVLLIGNTSDPITPLASARKVNGLLPDSRLLVHDGFGHTSLAAGQQSACTLAALGAYLVDQQLPAEGTVCQPDAAPFMAPPADQTGAADPAPTS